MPSERPSAPEPSSTSGPGQARPLYNPAQRRLLAVLAGLVVAVLAGGAFVLTYDVLRDLAIEGRSGRRWAPVYPVMYDALLTMTIFSLVVTRHARWWSRLLRWTLLIALLAGGAAIGVQRSVWGYASLPDDPLRAGIAVAPHVMLVTSVWLWLTMFKQLRGTTSPKKAPEPEAPVEIVKASPPALPPSSAPALPASPSTDVELVRKGSVPARTTQPDIAVPPPLALDDDDEAAPADRPEDPDAGEEEDLPIWDWNPPSGSLRSSPLPPAD
ncbi:DUF2637 domain-containing protein [Spirillospora sp. CA-294931]|uniref:DUF2637 domain-containing protein n=1 Tax=Spirillospora sp. CA-294931 TaxID=3240042 RepID=UPI003D915993